MKIAILTLPLHTNYGGILQAYALQTVLQRMGHEVEILQSDLTAFPHKNWLLPLAYCKRIARKILFDKKAPIFIEKKKAMEKTIIEQYTSQFINKYINLRKIKSLRDIKSGDYDAIVVGSDQIWRKPYFNGMWHSPINDAFLDFTKNWNIKRISYAASFGLDNISEYSTSDIQKSKKAIQQFDAVSVREDSGIAICKDNFDIKAAHVLDPTMLLTKDDYEILVKQIGVPESPGDMLCYILDPSEFKSKVISKIADKNSLTPFNVFAEIDNINLSPSQRVQPPVESWLRGFMDAKFIVTDSFHACVFSIIFDKPFIAIGNAERGMSRFLSLFTSFSLQNRLFLPEKDLETIPSNIAEIDNVILKKVATKKAESLSFIETALCDGC